MAEEDFAKRLLFDFFIHEAENLHDRVDWFLIFHGILFEAFVASRFSIHRIALGTLGVLASWVWLVAGIRQQWSLAHLANCMADTKIMGKEAGQTFRRLWDARNAQKWWMKRFKATPAFSVVLPFAVFTTWLLLTSTYSEGGAVKVQALLIVGAAILLVTVVWILLYRWPAIPPGAIEHMSSESDPDTPTPSESIRRW
jgi:hypothetical protein